MKLNNKGFAVSTVMYIILITAIILILAILSILGSRKLILDNIKKEVADNINVEGNVKLYYVNFQYDSIIMNSSDDPDIEISSSHLDGRDNTKIEFENTCDNYVNISTNELAVGTITLDIVDYNSSYEQCTITAKLINSEGKVKASDELLITFVGEYYVIFQYDSVIMNSVLSEDVGIFSSHLPDSQGTKLEFENTCDDYVNISTNELAVGTITLDIDDYNSSYKQCIITAKITNSDGEVKASDELLITLATEQELEDGSCVSWVEGSLDIASGNTLVKVNWKYNDYNGTENVTISDGDVGILQDVQVCYVENVDTGPDVFHKICVYDSREENGSCN